MTTAEQVPSEDELDALMAWLRDLANADPAMADAVRAIAALRARVRELDAESAPTSEEAEQVAARVEQWPYVDSGAAEMIRQQAREVARLLQSNTHLRDENARGAINLVAARKELKRAEQEKDELDVYNNELLTRTELAEAAAKRAESVPTSEEVERMAKMVESIQTKFDGRFTGVADLIRQQAREIARLTRACSALQEDYKTAMTARDAPTLIGVDGPVDPDGAIKSYGPDPSFGQGRMG